MRKKEIIINTILLDDDRIWFIEEFTNELFYYDIIKEQTFFFCEITGETYNKPFLFSKILKYQNHLILIPQSSSAIYKIDIASTDISRIEIKEKLLKDIPPYNAKFTSAHIIGDTLFLIGASCPFILKINLLNNYSETIFCKDIFANKDCESIYVRKTLRKDYKIIIPLTYTNSICIFDTINDKVINIITITEHTGGFSSICESEGMICLISRKTDDILICNSFFETIEKLNTKNISENEICFTDCISWNGDILVFPAKRQSILRICRDNERFEIKEALDREFENVYGISYNKQTLCFVDNPSNIVMFEDNSFKSKKIKIPIPFNIQDRIIKELKSQVKKNQPIYESYRNGLYDFISILQ